MARQTVTFDCGSEFAGYAAFDRHLALASYFCDPHSSWQKGRVENMNGRVRRFLPRHREPKALSWAHLQRISERLNEMADQGMIRPQIGTDILAAMDELNVPRPATEGMA